VPVGRVGLVGLGAVGARVARQLGPGTSLLPVSESRPALVEALRRELPIEPASPDVLATRELVVLAHPAPQAALAEWFLRRGVHVVATSDDVADVVDLLDLHELARSRQRLLVVGAAASPGLSGLLAAELATRLDVVDEIHVAAHGTGGPACARQHHRALAGTALGWHDGDWIRRPAGSGRELCWFPEPIGARDCYRAELADPLLLRRAFPDAERISARISANRRDRFTARLPMLTPPHPEGGIGAVRVELRGSRGVARATEVAGVSERTAIISAAVAAAAASFAVDGLLGVDSGAVALGQPGVVNRALLDDVRARGITAMEYAGGDSA
jgi:hypothetical protein